MSAATCILCTIYRPDADPRTPNRPPVCEGDRRRLGNDIADIGRYHETLVNPDPIEVDGYWYQARYQTWDGANRQWRQHWETRRGDPLAAIGGAGPTPSRSDQPHVAGTREPSTPFRIDEVDLTGAARRPNPTDQARRHAADQIGHLSTATVLYEIVRDWRDTLWPDRHLPAPVVPELVAWLRVGATDGWAGPRIDEACDQHPSIVDTATELRDLRRVLRSTAGESEPQPRRWLGLACHGCKKPSLIARAAGEEYAECGGCGLMYSDAGLTELLRQPTGRTPQAISA